MDRAGFVAIDDVLAYTGWTRAALDDVVRDNNKDRFQRVGSTIRAVQGHSLANTPVTLDGLEASWEEVLDDAPVFHGTSVEAARAILHGSDAAQPTGIHAAARSHVHLAPDPEATVGKRHQVAVLLQVDPTRLRARGLGVFRAPNGVLLVRRVPRACITAVLGRTAAGRAAQSEFTALLDGDHDEPAAPSPQEGDEAAGSQEP